MSFRRFILALLVAFMVLAVVLFLASILWLLAVASADGTIARAAKWTVATSVGLMALDLVLMVLGLACERVFDEDSAAGPPTDWDA